MKTCKLGEKHQCAKLDDGFYYFEDETEFKDLVKQKLGISEEEDSDTATEMDD